MNSFFSKYQRSIFAVVMSLVVVTMLFYGVGNKSVPVAKERPDVLYKVGSKGKERAFSKQKLESLKTYLTYDLGYDFNDALERQNIFADGFLLDLCDSSLGKGLIQEYFPLIKEDFAKKVAAHRKTRLYTHPSGKYSLEDELKTYAKDLYENYSLVQQKDREVDASLFQDYLALAGAQRYFRPRDSKLLTSIFLRDRKIGNDPTLDRRNFALFGTKSNGDMFGEAYIELVAQVVLAGEMFAKEHGYKTTYEEAKGVITRRALDNLGAKFKEIDSKEEMVGLKERFRSALGLAEEDLVGAARSIMTVQKMIKDVDATVVLDRVSAAKLYGDHVETLLVKLVQDSGRRLVKNPNDALELHAYLSAIGNTEKFLGVPKELYSKEEIYKNAEDLLVETYQLKLSRVSKDQVGASVSLKKVWDFQTGDAGWKAVSKEFTFDENLAGEERFAFLQKLPKEQASLIEKFSREKIVEASPKLIKEALLKQQFDKVDFVYNSNVVSGQLGEHFDEKRFVKLLSGMTEDEEVPCYTQDEETYYRVYLWKAGEKRQMPLFAEAKKNGYLAALIDKKLVALNNGKTFSQENRDKLLVRLLNKEAGAEVSELIVKAEEEGKVYTRHMEERIALYQDESFVKAEDPVLAQFNIYEENEVIARTGKNREIAKEEFFEMQEGETSSIYFLNNGTPYYIDLITSKVDEEKLSKITKAISTKLSKEARTTLYNELLSYIENNNMLVKTRFSGGVE